MPRSPLRREEPGWRSPFSPAGRPGVLLLSSGKGSEIGEHGLAPMAPTFPWGVGVPALGSGEANSGRLPACCPLRSGSPWVPLTHGSWPHGEKSKSFASKCNAVLCLVRQRLLA